MAQISKRAQTTLTDYDTCIPDISDNAYDAVTNPNGVISLALSENHLIHAPLTEYINKNFNIPEALATTYNGTTLGGPRLRTAMAAHVNKYFSPYTQVSAEEVLVANGVSAICAMLGFVLGDAGDGVLLMRPIYGKFENDWGVTARMKCIYVEMGDTDPFSEASVACYEQGLRKAEAEGIKLRVLQISNPHNPSGLCYPKSTLRALMRFCSTHNLHLVSDEIYALSIFPVPPPTHASDRVPQPFTSILSIDPNNLSASVSDSESPSTKTTIYSTREPTSIDPALLHVEYGLAKDFGAAGLHLGALITRNGPVQKAFEAISLLHAPSGASCHIGAQILEDGAFVEELLGLSRAGLAENYVAVTGMLDAARVPYWKGGNAGYFLWVDLSAYLLPPVVEGGEEGPVRRNDREREEELVERMVKGGVWLNPGQERGEKPGWFRLIFSHPKEKVVEGVTRIINTLKAGKEKTLPVRTQKAA